MSAERKLFGTDGVRGEAGTFLTAELATALGRAVTASLEAAAPAGPDRPRHPRVGADAGGGAGRRDRRRRAATRCSAACCRPRRRRSWSGGSASTSAAVVSASHNPYRDNGIKFFTGQGTKLPDDGRGADRGAARGARPRRGRRAGPGARARGRRSRTTCASCSAAFPLDLSGRRSSSTAPTAPPTGSAPAIFERLGAEVETIGVEPDGRNINDGCGSTHVEPLAERVAASEAEIGFAFDGDGDRVLAVDGHGPRPRRRRADRARRPRPRRPRRARRRRRRHRDDQLRLPPGDGGGRDRGRDHPGRRPLRDRRDAPPRLEARRRAVRPHHRLRLRLHRRRHRRGAD